MIRSWLMNSISKPIGQSVLFVKTAHAIWENLRKHFKQNNSPRLYHIEHQLYLLRQGSMDINTYYTRLVTIWEEMKTTQANPTCVCTNCVCEVNTQWHDLFERSIVRRFLFGLNESYEPIRAQIIMLDPLPDLDKAFNLIVQHESQSTIKHTYKLLSTLILSSLQLCLTIIAHARDLSVLTVV